MIYSKFFRISNSNSFTTVIFNVLTGYGYEASKLCESDIAAARGSGGKKWTGRDPPCPTAVPPPPMSVDLSPYLTRTATFGILSNLHRE